MLKSGEDIIADVKELKSNDEVVGYYFIDPQVVKVEESEAPTVLNEDGSFTKYSSGAKLLTCPLCRMVIQHNKHLLRTP